MLVGEREKNKRKQNENVVRAVALRSPQSRNSGHGDWALALFLPEWGLPEGSWG